MSKQWVYGFDEADPTNKSLLGGKGAALAGMTQAGLPVPPGFIITTEACAEYQREHVFPAGLLDEIAVALAVLEKKTGKQLGGAENPMLLSVRSGAPISMPGMMDTVLNLGISPEIRQALGRLTGDERFAWDAQRRFIRMFADVVMGVDPGRLDHATEAMQVMAGAPSPGEMEPDEVAALVDRLQDIVYGQTHRHVPDGAQEQLRMSIGAVFNSWSNKRARDYRAVNGIPDDLGTAVNVQVMVFGNTGEGSGTGVAFTRNPTSGVPVLYGEFLPNAQGEDVVAGIRTPEPISHMESVFPEAYAELSEIAGVLERHYRDMQDLEFTVESGKLWMLQTRAGKRTGRAAIRIAVDLVGDGLINQEEAVVRIGPDQLEQLLHPVVDPAAEFVVLAEGLPASPGAVSGRVVLTADDAVEMAETGEPVVLVRLETNPDDFHGMVAARATVTARGGVTSHAAVVARGMGKSCVVGCAALEIDIERQLIRVDGVAVGAGDFITVDGNNGRIMAGRVPTIEPETDEYFDTLMSWTDQFRRLGIRANADTPAEAAEARRLGAQGIGLCRTEHMFFGDERIKAMRAMIMAPNEVARREALARLEPHQVTDFEGIFEAMDGYPVTIRLLDPPLHEFLPSSEVLGAELTDLKIRLRRAEDLDTIDQLLMEINERQEVLNQVERLAESNPMLGHRGCRLGLTYPEVTEMQARAIFTAAIRCQERGISVHPEVMVPLVGFETELAAQATLIRRIADEIFAESGLRVEYTVGTMIELPRAALMADALAHVAEFFSFGTNDLTQMTLGMSRDDSGRFLPGYVRRGIIPADPFQTLDAAGVGQLITMGIERGKSTRPDLKIGVCGEHGGDPDSIAFCHSAGLDYVSCSPYRVPVARLAAAHAGVKRVVDTTQD
ncbi:MAG: pyruvate, phosphate dikinase [Acidimicrobiia bacterium]|nr:pyruvate, phosphate dikinase [Acidimicrobiia bacterium]